jgi:hypothetical protein
VPTLFIVSFLDDRHFDWVKMVILICISLMAKDVEHFVLYFLVLAITITCFILGLLLKIIDLYRGKESKSNLLPVQQGILCCLDQQPPDKASMYLSPIALEK